MAKRKTSGAVKNKTTKRLKPATRDTRNRPQTFRFLDLPAEIRTEILSLGARNFGIALLNRKSHGTLSTRDAIGVTNKQLREEYIGVLYQHAQKTVVHVLDFDFRHIVTFFNKLNEAEVRALPAKVKPEIRSGWIRTWATKIPADEVYPSAKAREFKILLDYGEKTSFASVSELLLRWLGRLDRDNKVGSNVDFSYGVVSRETGSRVREHALWSILASGPGKQGEELRKIKDAVRGPPVQNGALLRYEALR